jgi:hypothetical protein
MNTKINTTTQPINLHEIALKLSANNAIADKISETGIVFTAKQLTPKLPQFEALGDMSLIALRKDGNGNNSYVLPTLYSDGDEFVVCLPDLNRSVTTRFKVKSWQAGDLTYSVLETNGDIILKCAIACNRQFLDDVRTEFNGQLEGQGTETLKAIWLKEKPQIELPLRTLSIGIAFEVIGTGQRSRKYSTPMVNLKDSSGNEYHNVITNSALRNLIDSGCQQFMIKEVVEMKKDKTRTDKVILTPLDGADFSDLLSA